MVPLAWASSMNWSRCSFSSSPHSRGWCSPCQTTAHNFQFIFSRSACFEQWNTDCCNMKWRLVVPWTLHTSSHGIQQCSRTHLQSSWSSLIRHHHIYTWWCIHANIRLYVCTHSPDSQETRLDLDPPGYNPFCHGRVVRDCITNCSVQDESRFNSDSHGQSKHVPTLSKVGSSSCNSGWRKSKFSQQNIFSIPRKHSRNYGSGSK